MGHPALPHEIALQLACHRGEILFGNTAPDVQMVSGWARQETHFFTHLPRRALEAYCQELLRENCVLLAAFLGEQPFCVRGGSV